MIFLNGWTVSFAFSFASIVRNLKQRQTTLLKFWRTWNNFRHFNGFFFSVPLEQTLVFYMDLSFFPEKPYFCCMTCEISQSTEQFDFWLSSLCHTGKPMHWLLTLDISQQIKLKFLNPISISCACCIVI